VRCPSRINEARRGQLSESSGQPIVRSIIIRSYYLTEGASERASDSNGPVETTTARRDRCGRMPVIENNTGA
jgi:hypothetical protein